MRGAHLPLRFILSAVLLAMAGAIAAFEAAAIPDRLLAVGEHAASDEVFRMNRLTMTVERLIANGDMASVQKEVSAFGVDADVDWLLLVGPDGAVAASTRIETVGMRAEVAVERFVRTNPSEFKSRAGEALGTNAGKTYIDDRARTVHGFFPVQFNVAGSRLRPTLRGYLFIQHDYSAARARELGKSIATLYNEGIVLGGVLVLIWLFLHYAVTKRMRRLVAATERFASGDLDARTKMAGNDEMGTVARAFDAMADGVASSYRRLADTSRALEISEARFRSIVETTADWVWETDAALNYTYTNGRVADLLGYDPAEVLGRSFLDLVPAWDKERIRRFFIESKASGERFFAFEHTKLTRDGRARVFESTVVPVAGADGTTTGFRGVGRDVTERRREERVWRARLDIVEFAPSRPVDDILQKTLDEIEGLTGSVIGFYHFLEADQNTLSLQNWSSNTLKTMCTAEGKGRHYNISEAGVWVDAVYRRRPVIHNDYKSLTHKKGMPEGHAPVERELVVPIFRGDMIVAIIGVGNKSWDYDDNDVRVVTQIGDMSWDIVEAKRAEEALMRANAYNRGLIEASIDALVTIGPDGKVTDVNSATEAATGHPRSSLVGTDFADYFTEPEKARAGYNQAFSEGRVTDYPLEMRHRDGHTTPVLYNATVYRDEASKVVGVFAAARDVTVIKRAEEALRKNSELLERIFAATHFCVAYLDVDFNFIRVNTAYARACGYPPEFFSGKNHFSLYPHKENEAIFRQVVGGGMAHTAIAKPFVFPDHPEWGTTYWDWTLYPLKDAGGKVEALLFVLLDVTERKKAEDALREYQGHLEDLVKARTAELEAANKELESFSYSVSHDLRAPLRAAAGFTELLKKRVYESSDETTRHYMDVISGSAMQMGALIDDILSFSRMGRAQMSESVVDVSALVREAIAALEEDAKGREVEWRVEPLPEARGDAAMLRLVVANLVSNALKFTQPRLKAVIEIGAIPAGEAVDLAVEVPAGHNVYYVKDNGVGFDMKYVGKLFGLFQRLHRPEEFPGTGVGLANVRRIVSRHGGLTWAEGRLGEGAAFYFTLPSPSR